MHRSAGSEICAWALTALTIARPIAFFAEQPSDPYAPPDPVVRAVVQLLAIGPGERSKNRECAATGFFVNEEGYLLTNAHVVEDAKRCLAHSPKAKILVKFSTPNSTTARAVSCDVVALDEAHDLAILKTERPLPADDSGGPWPVLFLELSEVADSTTVAVTGHPLFAWQAITQSGKVVRRASLRLSESSPTPSEVLILDIPLSQGNSGSPVYLQVSNVVVGIVERQDPLRPSQTVAVPIRYAIELLDRHGIHWHAVGK